MFISDLLVAMVLGVIFAALLATAMQLRFPSMALAFLTSLLVAGVWAGGVWIGPVGPAIFAVYPFPFLFTGIVLALLFAAILSERRPAGPGGTPGGAGYGENPLAGSIAVFLWILLALLAFLILVRYSL